MMFPEGWIGFLESERGRSQGEMPVLGNDKVRVVGQVRAEQCPWAVGEGGKRQALASCRAEWKGLQQQLPASLRLHPPMLYPPQLLCASQPLNSGGLN